MNHTLKDISSIQTGIFAKPGLNGDLVYLQPQYFDTAGRLVHKQLPELHSEFVGLNHFLLDGDVLFSSKGTRNFATQYHDLGEPAVASTSFFVIRLHFGSEILPSFLVWYLNFPTTQRFLKDKATGTSIVSISKTVLKELAVPIFTVEKQQAMVEINQIMEYQNRLTLEIQELREVLVKNMLNSELNNMK